jgi:DNA-directed RNA polymerase subunit RPC12/RpoP
MKSFIILGNATGTMVVLSIDDKTAENELKRIVNILRKIARRRNVVISEPKLDYPCYRCRQPMSDADYANKSSYLQCFACGHKELKL